MQEQLPRFHLWSSHNALLSCTSSILIIDAIGKLLSRASAVTRVCLLVLVFAVIQNLPVVDINANSRLVLLFTESNSML